MTQKEIKEILEKLIEVIKEKRDRHANDPNLDHMYHFEDGYISALESICEIFLTEDEE